MKTNGSFQDRLKEQQAAWADANGLRALTEADQGRSWVLAHAHQTRNLFDPTWWVHIEGKEHRWARALNSSQCFAVNLFAPMIGDHALAGSVFRQLLPNQELAPGDEVVVELEFSPDAAREWLGERGHPTQVDAAMSVLRKGTAHGHVLIEVKLGETGFGTCRGAKGPDSNGRGNPRPDRCRNATAVLVAPEAGCWLTEKEGRRYWSYMSKPGAGFDFSMLGGDAACPFAGGLYQPMRNRVLADALVAETSAKWAEFAVTIHPENDVAHVLGEAVANERDAIAAFRRLVGEERLLLITPADVIDAIAGADASHAEWAAWMRGRYML
jgi:hypothetical protein